MLPKNIKMMKYFFIVLFLFSEVLFSQTSPYFEIARVKYSGGGDWYNDPSAEVNLLNYISNNTDIKTNPAYKFADIETNEIFNYPFLFITGHGNMVLSDKGVKMLKEYLENGGFLYVDDDYGLDKSFRREVKKVFPDHNLVELPFDNEIYSSFYKFKSGPPKTHEHNGKPPQGFGLFLGNRMVIYYTYESNPSDGWANADIHNDPPAKREEALRFGTNIVVYALSH